MKIPLSAALLALILTGCGARAPMATAPSFEAVQAHVQAAAEAPADRREEVQAALARRYPGYFFEVSPPETAGGLYYFHGEKMVPGKFLYYDYVDGSYDVATGAIAITGQGQGRYPW